MTPPWMLRVVLEWLKDKSVPQLEQMAQSETAVAPIIMGQYSALARKFARGYIGPEGIRQLQQAGDPEWDALINAIAWQRPDVGSVLLTHDVWFRRQLGQARDLFLHG
ncbi:hypothetical protein [Sulfobacillus harzensis]|uniref:Uncharacterized protein n=1 Tax=Sulfobacillus harzensis TaxID=2729629 RepID=A0A7Y0L2R0_9FIRM|nr:hypothetical protein [Sulfobacillus harzensis]NMP22214.1 hypothetical protein [Sulfobacillus harzensis]